MDMEPESIIRVTREQAVPAIDVLAAAFSDYPALKYYFPDEMPRQRIARYFISYPVYTGLRYGRVYATSPSMEGVAVWMPPGTYPVSVWQSLKSVPLSVFWGFGRYGGSRLQPLGRHVDAVHARLAPFPHWYLHVLGVRPELKGRGFSSRLVRPMLDIIAASGLPCYLETFDDHNVSIYEHFGFKLVDESAVPGSDLVNRAMLRK